jgi:mono/diheme cytochrome c family protein
MSADPKPPCSAPPSAPKTSEPPTYRDPMPVWIIILLLVLIFWGFVYFDTQGGWEPIVYRPYHSVREVDLYQPPPLEGPNIQAGRVLFEAQCGICHDNTGSGKPGQAPPLDGSDWVLGGPNRLIRIPQLGLTGPIKVKGQDYNFANSMPPIAAPWSDEDLVNVLGYIRQAWSNKAAKAAPITIQQVHAIREKVKGQPSTTPAALSALPPDTK